MFGFIALIHSTRNYKKYSAIAVLHTLQFTVTHALGFSVFTSRILATDLSTVIIKVSLNYILQIPHVTSYLHRLTLKSQLNSLPSPLSHLPLQSQETPSILSQLPGILVT
jgi:hypothetical protein